MTRGAIYAPCGKAGSIDRGHNPANIIYLGGHSMFENYPDVLNVEHLCEILGIGKKLVYRLLKNNDIEHLQIGRSYRIPKPNLVQYLLKQSA